MLCRLLIGNQCVRGRNFEEITAYSTPKCLDRQIPFFVHRQDDARVCPDAKLAGEVLKKLLKFMPEGGLEPPDGNTKSVTYNKNVTRFWSQMGMFGHGLVAVLVTVLVGIRSRRLHAF